MNQATNQNLERWSLIGAPVSIRHLFAPLIEVRDDALSLLLSDERSILRASMDSTDP